MDAAHTFKKIAFYLAPALLIAANASAQLLVNGSAATSVTITGNQSATLNVTSGTAGTPLTFSVTSKPSFLTVQTNNGTTTPATVTLQIANTGCLLSSSTNPPSCTGNVVLTGSDSSSASIAVTYQSGTTGGGVISASTTSVTLNAPAGGVASQGVTLSTSSTTPISFNVTSNQPSIFTVSPASGSVSSGSSILLSISNSVQNTGQYTGSITVTPTSGGNPLQISVTLNQGTGTGSSTISASPNPATLSFPGTNAQCVSVSSNNSATFSAQASSSNGWLALNNGTASLFNAPVGSCGLVVQLGAAVNSLASGTYFGSVQLTNSVDATSTTISVQLTVGGGSTVSGLSVSPTALTFTTSSSTVFPGQQSIFVQCASSCSTTSISPSTTSSGWLSVGLNSSVLPATITVNANPSGLSQGTYNGTVNIGVSGGLNGTQQIPVSLTVGSSGTTTGGVAAPTALNFAYQSGSSIGPQSQSVLVQGSGTINIPVANVVQSPRNFFSVSGTGQAPGRAVVTVFTGLPVGSYTGSFVVQDDTGSQSVSVTLSVNSGVTLMDSAGDITCFFQVGVQGCNNNVTFSASDGSNLPLTVTSSASWVTVSGCTGTNGTTPSTCAVAINAAGLANGLNSASLNVTATGAANGSYSIPVVVLVSGSSGGGGNSNLTLSTSTLSFTGVAGGSSPANQTLGVTASTVTNFTAAISSPASCPWLTISPLGSLTTPANINVAVNTAGLQAGSYNNLCSINLNANGGLTTVPVNLTVSTAGAGGNVTVSPTAITLTAIAGGTPAAQALNVANTASGTAAITFTATATSAQNWLQVSPTTAQTPVNLTVTANSASLPAGTYTGNIAVTPTGGSTVNVPVTLTVQPAVSVSATPATLSFTYSAGGSLPSAQQVQVSGNGGALTFTAVPSASWIVVSPTSGTTPTSGTSTLQVSVDPTNLTVNQNYNGTIVVSGTNGASGSTTINVSLTITAPLPTITRVASAASLNPATSISAGEIVTIFGSAMGPTTLNIGNFDANGQFPTTLAGVQVLIGGYPAPLVFVRNDQVAAIVPYEINKPFVANPNVLVKYLGQSSNGIAVSQVASAPGLFTANSSGTGPGAILNSNLSVNTIGNPANKGDTIVLYMTGEGQTSPAGVTGKRTTVTTVNGQAFTPQPLLPVAVTIDGQPAQVVFYGEAPGLVAGVMQVNVVVPTTVQSGDRPVVVTVGGNNSQTDSRGVGAVTVSIK